MDDDWSKLYAARAMSLLIGTQDESVNPDPNENDVVIANSLAAFGETTVYSMDDMITRSSPDSITAIVGEAITMVKESNIIMDGLRKDMVNEDNEGIYEKSSEAIELYGSALTLITSTDVPETMIDRIGIMNQMGVLYAAKANSCIARYLPKIEQIGNTGNYRVIAEPSDTLYKSKYSRLLKPEARKRFKEAKLCYERAINLLPKTESDQRQLPGQLEQCKKVLREDMLAKGFDVISLMNQYMLSSPR